MKLEIFEKTNRTRVELIKTYTFVQYVKEFNGQGKFEITLPIQDDSLIWLTYGNYILFDDGVVGIIKGRRDVEDSDTEIKIYGYLINHILTFRSFLLTAKYYDTPGNIARQMFDDLFISSEDVKRHITFLTLSSDPEFIPSTTDKIRVQNTGDNYLDVVVKMFSPYGLGVDLYPIFKNYQEEPLQYANLDSMELRVITPVDRTVNNTDGNIPVVFSFDLDNLLLLEYEEDGRDYNSVAIVASEGVGQERKVIEVGDVEKTGIDRIELYVDARDLQSDSETNTDTEEIT